MWTVKCWGTCVDEMVLESSTCGLTSVGEPLEIGEHMKADKKECGREGTWRIRECERGYEGVYEVVHEDMGECRHIKISEMVGERVSRHVVLSPFPEHTPEGDLRENIIHPTPAYGRYIAWLFLADQERE